MTRRLPLLALALACVAAPPPASALELSGDPSMEVLDAAGQPFALAGGHPDVVKVGFGFETDGDEGLDGNPKELVLDFPPGFSGDSNAVTPCPRRVFEASVLGPESCAPESQVGVATVTLSGFFESSAPIYNVETAPGQAAVQGVAFAGKLNMLMRLRPSDLGLRIELSDLTQNAAVSAGEIELWGVPADHREEGESVRRPFITLPTRCDQGPLSFSMEFNSWQQPGSWATGRGSTGVPLVGCDTLAFDPRMEFSLTDDSIDSPSGARLEITAFQDEDPDGRASAAIGDVDVALPGGLSISPGAVARLAVCSDAQLRRGSDRPAACPRAARVGAVQMDSPQLEAPLTGDVYLGEERPGERFRLFLVLEDDGVSAKFVGVLEVDPASGQISIALGGLPQLAFDLIRLDLGDGQAGLLATPMSCGELTATASFARHDGLPGVDDDSTTTVSKGAGGGDCPAQRPFSPQLSGGTTVARAGQGSGLTLTLRRRSGEELLDRFEVTLPRGLSPAFEGVQICSEGTAAAAACPPGSRIGSAQGAVGSGDDPAVLGGEVYLTGPYRRAPFGLALVFRAKIGSFDLGVLVARAMLRIDPRSGRLSVRTDPLPRSIDGLPIRFQGIGLDIDRTGFIRNPTSCEPTQIEARVGSAAGSGAILSTPFALRGCNSLRFAPRLSVGLAGARRLRRGGHPQVRVAIRSGALGHANLRSVNIALPRLLRRDLGGLEAICARQDALEGRCPPESRIGAARAATPAFRRAAVGPVSLVRPRGDGPPEIWATLRAEGARLSVRGKVFARSGRVYTRLTGLPDLPLSRLLLRLDGGRGGLLALRSSPCRRRGPAVGVRSALTGQNDAYRLRRGRVGVRCGRFGRSRARTSIGVGSRLG